jgi:hypothetical protein
MALGLEKGYDKLIKTVALGNVGQHKDYKRVTELSDLYERLITGEDAGKLLIRFTPREDKDQFKQRVKLTQLLTPAITEKIMQPFYKVSRIDNVKKGIIFDGKKDGDVEGKIKIIQKAFDEYHGDEGLVDFMETEFVDLVFTDPNSFIVTEFEDFNSDIEKAKPFPFLVSSEEAINYKYKNNVLQFLVVEKKITFEISDGNKKTIIKDGSKFRLYLNDVVIVLTEVNPKLESIDSLVFDPLEFDDTVTTRIKIGERVFVIEINETNAGQVPAIRVGYKRDISTKGRTMLSPMHKAVPRMMKSVKAVSELDLTNTLHVFPQKMQYVESCKGVANDVCRNGKNIKDENCRQCSGTGLAIHKSSADTITFAMPSDPKDMMELDKLLTYKNPPVDLIKWQDEYVEKLEKKCLTDVFVSESLNNITKTQTATEKELDMESIYDTLFPFAKRYSAVYIKQGELTAIYVDNEDAVILHKFPKDFKLKTEKALMQDLKEAKESGASTFLKTEIENDLAVKVYGDDPIKLRQYRVKQQHKPFTGKTPEEILLSINLGLTTKFDKILYANFDSIMGEIDQEQMKGEADFYLLSYDKRADLIAEKVADYIKLIEEEKGSSTMFNGLDDEEDVV